MRQGTPPRESMISQVVTGVVVSVVTTVLLKGLGLADSSQVLTADIAAPPAASVRLAFSLPEPAGPQPSLFNCKAIADDPELGFLPETLRLHSRL